MPPRTRVPLPRHAVTAVLVSHDGREWLPAALAALRAQKRPPQSVVGVDTGSTDGSADMLAEFLGADNVVVVARDVGLPIAIQRGLEAAKRPTGRTERVEWVWVLHDDAQPAPDALLELLHEAERSPSATVLGPKQLAADGQHLLEVGATMDGSGHRRTGVEPGELDQGQRDELRDVLAVSTAGMLVRRDVWDRLDGLDPSLALFGEDVDFGWRATAAGERVVVVPRATLRHAAALTTGCRTPDAVPGRASVARRAHGMRVVLANTASALVPVLMLRYLVEGLLRALGLLVVRRPSDAYDELAATMSVLGHPGRIADARRRRRGLRTRNHREIRALLPGAGERMRRGGDALAHRFRRRDTAVARQRHRMPVESGPIPDEAQPLEPASAGVLASLMRRPGVLLFVGLTAVALIADRHLFGNALHGGRLLPADQSAHDLWSTYLATWHPVGLGSTTPAPPLLAVMAMLSTVLLGKAWLAVDVLLLWAVPLAGISAYWASGAITGSKPVRVWAAVAYAFVPAVTGAVATGRLDVVVAVILLPLLARAVCSAARSAGREHGWHRAVAAGLLLAVACAFAPIVWVLTAVAALGGAVLSRQGRRGVTAVVVVLLTGFAVLLPWSAHVVAHPRLLVAGAGLPEPTRASHPLSTVDVLLLRPGGPGQPPMWVWTPYLLAALVGLARTRGRLAGRVGWVVLVTGLAGVLVVSRLHSAVAGVPDSRYWTGLPVAVTVLGALVAGAAAASGSRVALSRHSFGWRQPTALLLAALAATATVVGAASWLVRGAGDPLTAQRPTVLPVFAAATLSAPTSPRVLVLRTDGSGLRYTVVRSAGEPALGAADVAPASSGATAALTAAVRSAVAGQPGAAGQLADFGVGLVVVPSDEAGRLRGLDNVDGLTRVPTSGAVVWRVGSPAGELAVRLGTATTLLRASPGSADVAVPAGLPGRLLVLAEAHDDDWRATFDGRPLTAAPAGWAQAWSLPAGAGRVQVRHHDSVRRAELVAEAVLIAIALLACMPAQRRRPEASQP